MKVDIKDIDVSNDQYNLKNQLLLLLVSSQKFFSSDSNTDEYQGLVGLSFCYSEKVKKRRHRKAFL